MCCLTFAITDATTSIANPTATDSVIVTSSAAPSQQQSSDLSTGAIVGIAVGVVAALAAALALLGFFILRRRRSRKVQEIGATTPRVLPVERKRREKPGYANATLLSEKDGLTPTAELSAPVIFEMGTEKPK